MFFLTKPRNILLIVYLGCIGLMMGAMYFQHILKLEPCPLCITQRVFVISVGLVAFGFWYSNPKTSLLKIGFALNVLLAAGGGSIAIRQLWLQSLPEELAPACGPSLTYMFETLPFWNAISVLFAGDGNCAEVVWTLFGISIPGWTLVAFIGLCFIHLWGLFQLFTSKS
ncbi:disulfide bond formation protein B [Teredinibacter sp. KSP-S5-2]|uniref:disulfide bond formation protein B n=1 Tax=Teredinibacter sp. KSP-S5-2 TaxID=3034506 RepID=UPI00293505B3|nr:disulfide bond formation protein B [Teredinibacter sp. KSP-S5-2]WNO08985.1 disulfide bond formation protein B [Teredinibacter sp. KSP-S5-2]